MDWTSNDIMHHSASIQSFGETVSVNTHICKFSPTATQMSELLDYLINYWSLHAELVWPEGQNRGHWVVFCNFISYKGQIWHSSNCSNYDKYREGKLVNQKAARLLALAVREQCGNANFNWLHWKPCLCCVVRAKKICSSHEWRESWSPHLDSWKTLKIQTWTEVKAHNKLAASKTSISLSKKKKGLANLSVIFPNVTISP